MNIIVPTYIYTEDALLQNLSIAFDKTIKKIAPTAELIKKFPDAKLIQLQNNSLIMPGLINAHVHLEFSANKQTLKYGEFIPWLNSIIDNRDSLINDCDSACIQKAIESMLLSGTTSFGAVSSYGLDLNTVAKSPQNIVFFNEIIGSKAQMVDALFEDFKQRLTTSQNIKKENFYPAIAIHSPYSVHPILIKKAIKIAKEQNLKLSAHFLESQAELQWLRDANGSFKPFFKELLQQNVPLTTIDEFLSYFKEIPTLMTHVVKATPKELKQLAQSKHTVVHCPISNRLLGNGAINIDNLRDNNLKWICATDGLSSNYTLNLFEELKIALFMHHGQELLPLAKQLIRGVTEDAADALGLNTGQIKQGKNADMLVISLACKPDEQLPIHLILHQYNISKIYINGKLIQKEQLWKD